MTGRKKRRAPSARKTNRRGKKAACAAPSPVAPVRPEPAAPADRGSFIASAPAARATLVADLGGLLSRAPLGEDEAYVMLHILAYAGYGQDGRLHVPSFAALWGEAPSYVPAVRLEPERVAAAVRLLRRRGLLKAAEDDVLLDAAALRALAG